MKRFHIFILLTAFYFSASAQIFPEKNYPKGYFRNPLGIPLQLSTNFGEIRTNHFHMGFDIRTAQRENLPVYAAADGYISRIKIEEGGFGRAIYITHPNGYTTLYAHLNAFTKELDEYVKQCQYENESWEQDRVIPATLFPVKKGDFIAFSGNTGASAGPHLHFEIRDTETENLINPWLFNFNLADNIPPAVYGLYTYDRRYSTYRVDPTRIAIKGAGGKYSSVVPEVVVATPEFSFGLSAEDKTNGSPFMFGIYEAEVWLDDSLVSAFRLNDLSYNEARYINASIDYKAKMMGGRGIHHLSLLPGNKMNIYTSRTGDGVIRLTDNASHKVLINVKDAAGNTSKLQFNLRYDESKKKDLLFTANSIPLQPNKPNDIKLDNVEVSFSQSAFYDVVPFVASSQPTTENNVVSDVHQLHNYSVPVHNNFTVRLKASKAVNAGLADKVLINLVSKTKKVNVKATKKGEWFEGNLRELGTVKLVVDDNPPLITPINFKDGSDLTKAKSISISAKDVESDIETFRAEVDGKWLLFVKRNNSYTYVFDENCPPGSHQLTVTATDIPGNTTTKTYSFTR